MSIVDTGTFRNTRVLHKSRLDLSRPDSVSRDVQHIIDPACNPVVSILITRSTVPGEVAARIRVHVHKKISKQDQQ